VGLGCVVFGDLELFFFSALGRSSPCFLVSPPSSYPVSYKPRRSDGRALRARSSPGLPSSNAIEAAPVDRFSSLQFFYCRRRTFPKTSSRSDLRTGPLAFLRCLFLRFEAALVLPMIRTGSDPCAIRPRRRHMCDECAGSSPRLSVRRVTKTCEIATFPPVLCLYFSFVEFFLSCPGHVDSFFPHGPKPARISWALFITSDARLQRAIKPSLLR